MKNRIRITFQLIFLALILYVGVRPFFDKAYLADFEKYCPFGGISSLFAKLEVGTLACNMNETQIFLGLGLLLTAGLIGKLFCSYVCPIGTVTEWLGRLGERLKIRREIPAKLDRWMRVLKYLLLFITVYFTMTSSELFCKTFDPYFAAVNLFGNNDIVLYYAIPAFIITVGGAIIFRLFWCKYLCPLGALTNIFMNIGAAGSVIVLFFAANLLGAGLSFVWLLGGLVAAGMVNEVGFMRSFFMPIPKIRKGDACSNCGFCDAKCPQGINISEVETVNHIDCNLCTDCVYSCPKANVLSINNKKNLKYLSPIVVVIVIAASLVAASYFEFTTLSVQWGKPAGQGAVYRQAGIKNVKCFGSSKTLAGQLEGIEGIYGLDTYAQSHTVVVYYDPSVISEKEVKESLFTSRVVEITAPDAAIEKIGVIEIGVFELFDQIDLKNFSYLMEDLKGVFAFETHFGEPVKTTVYYNPGLVKPADIYKQIGKKSLTVKLETGETKIDLSFKPENEGTVKESLTYQEYMTIMFDSYDDRFNNYDSYKPEDLSVLVIPMPDAEEMWDQFPYLTSHLSANEGIVRFMTGWSSGPTAYIYFDSKKTTADAVKKELSKPKLSYFVSETEKEEIDNPFSFNLQGKVIKASEMGK